MFNKHLVALPITALVFGMAGPVKAEPTVDLQTAAAFAVLGGTAVTNVPTSTISGDVGLSPAAGSNYDAGVTTGQVTGTIYAVDGTGPAGSVNNPALLTTAKNNLTTAYLDAAGRIPGTTFVAGDNQLGGQILTSGVYAFGGASTANLVGTLTLNGQNNANAVFIFQASSSLVTASSSVVQLINGAQACNVFWQVTSSATLGSNSSFVGTIMALTSVGLNTGATLEGRALARNAAVTLDQNTITRPICLTTTSGTAGSGALSDAAGLAPEATTLPNAGPGAVGYVSVSSLLYGLWQLRRRYSATR